MTHISGPMLVELEGHRFEIPDLNHSNLFDQTITTSELEVVRNEKKYSLMLVSVDLDTRTCIIEINGQEKKAKIIREIDIMIERMGLNATQSKNQRQLIAPMPGLVKDIHVAEGQHVAKGDPLLILEAMKMENVLSAPHEAQIKKVNVIKGQAVERGLALIEFSPLLRQPDQDLIS